MTKKTLKSCDSAKEESTSQQTAPSASPDVGWDEWKTLTVSIVLKHYSGYTNITGDGVRSIRHVVDIDDLIQEGLKAVLEAKPKYQDGHKSGASLRSYMYHVIKRRLASYIMRNSSPMVIKSRKGMKRMSTGVKTSVMLAQRTKLFSDIANGCDTAVGSNTVNDIDVVDKRDECRWMLDKMRKILTSNEMQVFFLRVFGSTYKRISEDLSISQATAKRRYKSAVTKTREAVGHGPKGT